MIEKYPEKWTMITEHSDGKIIFRKKIYIECRNTLYDLIYKVVRQPNFIERLFGITFEFKVEKTRIKCKNHIDKLNKKVEIAQKFSGCINNE